MVNDLPSHPPQTLPARLFTQDFGPFADTVSTLAEELSASAEARDKSGGTALAERQLLRDSGLLTLAVPKTHGGHGAARLAKPL